MKILEVAFDDYVRCPHNMHNTNVLRVSHDNSIGTSVMVDALSEDTIGVVATKTITQQSADGERRVTYTSRYPWGLVKDVKYEPSIAPATTAQVEKKK